MGSFPDLYWVFAHFSNPGERSKVERVQSAIMQPDSERMERKDFFYISIGILAWNEEATIEATLRSLFQQSIFSEIGRRNLRAEVVCVLNGCSDNTPTIAGRVLEQPPLDTAVADSVSCRVVNLTERGKLNAWNQFVHSLSASSSKYLFLVDADIIIHRLETLQRMLEALERDSRASVAVDVPCKDIRFKPRKSVREKLSLRASALTLSADAQLCAQLYVIRSEVARQIYLPKDLPACEDGFIKALVCTDFLLHGVLPERIRVAEGAEHTFEAYTSPVTILRNQKRQMIGQTVVHLLIDQYLSRQPLSERVRLGEILRKNDAVDPDWLKRLISEHLRRIRFFWRLYPDVLSCRFQRLATLEPLQRLWYLPTAAAGFGVSLVACWLAYRFLRAGSTDYWPREGRFGPRSAQLAPQSL
jgi:glycosyltransferase involved in cell wall biosynthesis